MNKIHPTAIIGDNVLIGDNNEIGAYTIIEGPTKIGDNNHIGHHVIIGSPGQDTRNPRYDSKDCIIDIGNSNIIREFTAIQKPCYKEVTKLGNNIFLMQSVHIPHDAQIYDNVVITPMCVLGGITTLLRGANIAMGTTIHQYTIIGHFSIAGMGSAVTKNIRPFTVFVSGKSPRVNRYAVEKFGFQNYLDEISNYVLFDIKPTSDILLEITDEFDQHHRDSKRAIYK